MTAAANDINDWQEYSFRYVGRQSAAYTTTLGTFQSNMPRPPPSFPAGLRDTAGFVAL